MSKPRGRRTPGRRDEPTDLRSVFMWSKEQVFNAAILLRGILLGVLSIKFRIDQNQGALLY